MGCLGIVKDLFGADHVAGALCLLLDHVPVVRMLIGKWHVRQRLAPVRDRGLAGNRPLLTAVPFAAHKSLPHKIAGGQRDRQGDLRKIGSRHQGEHTGRRGSDNSDLAYAMGKQPVYCCLDSLERIVVMTIIFLSRGHGHDIEASLLQPGDTFSGQVILRVVSNHGNHRGL